MLTSQESAISSIVYSTVALNFDFWPQIVKRSSLSHNALSCKFGENVSNTLQDIVLNMFEDARMHRWTGQNHYPSGVLRWAEA